MSNSKKELTLEDLQDVRGAAEAAGTKCHTSRTEDGCTKAGAVRTESCGCEAAVAPAAPMPAG
ncbi:MAG: hypothetical protein ACRBN8_21185 [Nannocystales bacterium]